MVISFMISSLMFKDFLQNHTIVLLVADLLKSYEVQNLIYICHQGPLLVELNRVGSARGNE